MRTRRFTMNGSYGFAIPSAMLRPVPQPQPFGAFGGAWEDWCDQNYWTAENNAKCKNCNQVNIPLLGPRCTWPDPKTMAGRAARGIPQQTDLERLGPPPGDTVVTIPEAGEAGESWFDKNKTTVLAVGGVAALALVALSFGRRGRRMNGLAGFLGFRKSYRRRRKSRRG